MAWQLERLWQAGSNRTCHAARGDEAVKVGSGCGRRPQLRDRAVAIGDDEPLPPADAPEVDTEVATELGHAYRLAHVHESSTSHRCDLSSSPDAERGACRGGGEAVPVRGLRGQAVTTGRQGAAAEPSGEADTVGAPAAADREAADLAMDERRADREAADRLAGERSSERWRSWHGRTR